MNLDILHPPITLLVKLGSIAKHTEELLTLTADAIRGHHVDLDVLKGLLQDPEVVEWMTEMSKIGMLPVMR